MKRNSLVFTFLWLLVYLVAFVFPVYAQESRADLSLWLISYGYDTRAEAGKETKSFLEVRNIGNKAVNNILLSADLPEGWTIRLDPERISYLGVGDVRTVDVYIQVPEKARAGGYTVTFIADAEEIRKVNSMTLRVREPTLLWIWVGLAIGVVVVAAFVFIFLRLGRK